MLQWAQHSTSWLHIRDCSRVICMHGHIAAGPHDWQALAVINAVSVVSMYVMVSSTMQQLRTPRYRVQVQTRQCAAAFPAPWLAMDVGFIPTPSWKGKHRRRRVEPATVPHI